MRYLKKLIIANMLWVAASFVLFVPMVQAQEIPQPLSPMKPLKIEVIDWRCHQVVDGLLAYAHQLKVVHIAYAQYLSQMSRDYQKWSLLLKNQITMGGVWEKGYFSFMPESLLRMDVAAELMLRIHGQMANLLLALIPQAEICTQDQDKIQFLTANMKGFLKMLEEHLISTSEFVTTMMSRLESQSQAWILLEGRPIEPNALALVEDIEFEAWLFFKAAGIVEESSIWVERRFNKFASDVEQRSW